MPALLGVGGVSWTPPWRAGLTQARCAAGTLCRGRHEDDPPGAGVNVVAITLRDGLCAECCSPGARRQREAEVRARLVGPEQEQEQVALFEVVEPAESRIEFRAPA